MRPPGRAAERAPVLPRGGRCSAALPRRPARAVLGRPRRGGRRREGRGALPRPGCRGARPFAAREERLRVAAPRERDGGGERHCTAATVPPPGAEAAAGHRGGGVGGGGGPLRALPRATPAARVLRGDPPPSPHPLPLSADRVGRNSARNSPPHAPPHPPAAVPAGGRGRRPRSLPARAERRKFAGGGGRRRAGAAAVCALRGGGGGGGGVAPCRSCLPPCERLGGRERERGEAEGEHRSPKALVVTCIR